MGRPVSATCAHDVDVIVDEAGYEGPFRRLHDSGIPDGPQVRADVEDLPPGAEHVADSEVFGRIHVRVFDEQGLHGQTVVMGGER